MSRFCGVKTPDEWLKNDGYQMAMKMLDFSDSKTCLDIMSYPLFSAANLFNDEDAKKALLNLRGVFYAIERRCGLDIDEITEEKAKGKFLDFLMEKVYFRLPVSTTIEGKTVAALLETKTQIIEFVISRWRCRPQPDEKSLETFYFLLQVVEPVGPEIHNTGYPNKYAIIAKDRKHVQSQEREKVLSLISKHIEDRSRSEWDLQGLNYWLSQSHLSARFRQVLLMAKAKNCNNIRDIHNEIRGGELLCNLYPERWSSAGMSLYAQIGGCIEEWDSRVKTLLKDFEKIPVGIKEEFSPIDLTIDIRYGNFIGYHPSEVKDLYIKVTIVADKKNKVVITPNWHTMILKWYQNAIEEWRSKSHNFSLRYAEATYRVEVLYGNEVLCSCEDKKESKK